MGGAKRPLGCFCSGGWEGGFGEVWAGANRGTRDLRVFKFCFMRSAAFFKRELMLSG